MRMDTITQNSPVRGKYVIWSVNGTMFCIVPPDGLNVIKSHLRASNHLWTARKGDFREILPRNGGGLGESGWTTAPRCVTTSRRRRRTARIGRRKALRSASTRRRTSTIEIRTTSKSAFESIVENWNSSLKVRSAEDGCAGISSDSCRPIY